MKILSKGLGICIAFFGTWLLLAQIDFVSIFHVKEVKSNTEKKIGDLIWDQVKVTEKIIYDDSITTTLDEMLLPLCEENSIQRDSLKVHIIKKDEINAFAMPDGHLIVYTGLIEAAKKQEALLGVLGHEIAHIEGNHVMKKLSKEIGFSMLISMTGADTNIIKEVLKTLSLSAYDRSLEEEADLKSVDYMINANIDPRPFADFMYELSLNDELHRYMYWISTHPESEARANSILDQLKGKKIKSKPVLSVKSWERFKLQIREHH